MGYRITLGQLGIIVFLGASVFLAFNASIGYAQPPAAPRAASYEITRYTIDGGGGTSTSTSPAYTLTGTMGQPDAGVLANAPYSLAGGFWLPLELFGHPINLPLIIR